MSVVEEVAPYRNQRWYARGAFCYAAYRRVGDAVHMRCGDHHCDVRWVWRNGIPGPLKGTHVKHGSTLWIASRNAMFQALKKRCLTEITNLQTIYKEEAARYPDGAPHLTWQHVGASMRQWRRKHVECTAGQIECLVDHMTANPDLVKDFFTMAYKRRVKRRTVKWNKLVNILNQYGPERYVQQWKQTWKTLMERAQEEELKAQKEREEGKEVELPPMTVAILQAIFNAKMFDMANLKQWTSNEMWIDPGNDARTAKIYTDQQFESIEYLDEEFEDKEVDVDEQKNPDKVNNADDENNADEEYNADNEYKADEQYNADQEYNADKEYIADEEYDADQEYNADKEYNADEKYNADQEYNVDKEYNADEEFNAGLEYNADKEYNADEEANAKGNDIKDEGSCSEYKDKEDLNESEAVHGSDRDYLSQEDEDFNGTEKIEGKESPYHIKEPVSTTKRHCMQTRNTNNKRSKHSVESALTNALEGPQNLDAIAAALTKYIDLEKEKSKMAHEREMARIQQTNRLINIFEKFVDVLEDLAPSVKKCLLKGVNGKR